MQTIEIALLEFFERVALKDSVLLEAFAGHPEFTLEQGRWVFTLPALHEFLLLQNTRFKELEYMQFRSEIFNCPINQTIKAHGAEIIIIDNHGKVDKSEYALIWQKTG